MADGFVDIVIGAVIAGVIGLLAVWAQQWVRKRQYVKENILSPVYNFLMDLSHQGPDEHPGFNPWPRYSWSERRKVPPRIKKVIEAFSDAWEEYAQADKVYTDHLHDAPQRDLVELLAAALSNHLDSQGTLPLGTFGAVFGATMEVRTLFDNVHRPIIRHLDDPDSAWEEIEASERLKKDTEIFRVLREEYPETLERIHAKLKSNPFIKAARGLLEEADRKHAQALRQGNELRKLLERKLG